MAILAIFTGNIDKAQYDALSRKVDWLHDQPSGAILHVASFDDAGHIHVADVWESPEKLNAFVASRLMPAMQALGFASPSVEVYPAATIQAYGGIKSHQI